MLEGSIHISKTHPQAMARESGPGGKAIGVCLNGYISVK